MGKVTESKTFAAIALLLVVATIIFSVVAGLSQLSLIPLFFCCIAAFSHVMSLMLKRMSMAASRKLDICAIVCIILFFISFVVICFVG